MNDLVKETSQLSKSIITKLEKEKEVERETKFHYVQGNTLVELIRVPNGDNKFKFLIWNEDNKSFVIKDKFLGADNEIYPPANKESFLKETIIPTIIDEEDFQTRFDKFDNVELDKRIDLFLRRWFVLPEEYFLVLRLFIKFSWVHEQSYMKSYLSLWGDRGTGKTMIGIFLSWLCRFPYFNKAGATPAVIARSLDLIRGILVLDESDMYLNQTSEETASFMRIMRGYHADATYDVVDENRKSKFPRQFRTGVPKVIFSAKPIKDDHLSSRCIVLELKPTQVPVEMIRDTKNRYWNERKKEAQEIVNDLLIFRVKKFFDDEMPKTIIDGVEPRYNDVAMPLFYMIDDKDEHKMFYNFVFKNVQSDLENRSETNDGQLLYAIKKLMIVPITDELFKDKYPKIVLNDISKTMKEMFFADINEREVEKIINNRKVGWYLKNLGIKVKKDHDKRFIDPDSFPMIESLFVRFGVKDDDVESLLTNKDESDIMEGK